jgi:hypothetical protein
MKKASLNLILTLTIAFLAMLMVFVFTVYTYEPTQPVASDEEKEEIINETTTDTLPEDEYYIESVPNGNTDGNDSTDANGGAGENEGTEGNGGAGENEGVQDTLPPSKPEGNEANDNTDVVAPDEDKTPNEDKAPETGDVDNNDVGGNDNADDDTIDHDDVDDEKNNVFDTIDLNLWIEEFYSNSQADGYGSMLWMLNVSYNGLNATDLLAQHGYYLVYRTAYEGHDIQERTWYSFVHSVYFLEEATYNSTGFMPQTKAIQFAVVKAAPTDEVFGGYDNLKLTYEHFVGLSRVYVNSYFA